MASTTNSLTEKAAALYQGEALAPMVRASTPPLRMLSLKYGADFVYTEELVDRSISETVRMENKVLNTVDYVKDTSNLSKRTQRRLAREGNAPALILRVDRERERGKLVCQLGTGEPELTLEAAAHVRRDVDAFDINMGCPKKFSVSGGMGSALLTDPERACRIVKKLRDNLDEHPVSCKIRLLKDTQSTVDLITALANAGAHAIAIHARRVGDDCVNPAAWGDLEEVIPLVRAKFPTLPLLANGDFYTRQDFMDFKTKNGINGVLLGRPALYNTSIFRKPDPSSTPQPSSAYGYNSPLLLDKTLIVQDYLREAMRYDTHYKNVKYVISEMMNNRRTPSCRVPFLPQCFPGNQSIGRTCDCSSLEALCKLWDVAYTKYDSKTLTLPAGEHKYEDSYFLKHEENYRKSDVESKTERDDSAEEKKEKDEDPPHKRVKVFDGVST